MLSLYLDDSGSQETGTVFVMGGLVANERQWNRFGEEWCLALKEAKIPMFHATEYYTRQVEPFKSWPNETHVKFSKRFAAIAARHMGAGVSRGVDVAGFGQYIRSRPDIVFPHSWLALKVQPQGVLPVMFNTRVCLEWVVRAWPDRPRDEPIEVIFDSGTYGLGATIEYCRYVQQNTVWARPYAKFGVADKSKVLPLQGADLMAWLSYKQLKREIESAGQPTHKALQRLADTKRISVSVGTKRSLPVFVEELRRFREAGGDVP